MVFKIPFSGRAHKYLDPEIATVVNAMTDANPLTQGKYRDEFEKKISEYLHVDYCYTVCNATAGLELTAQLCQFEEGDEIIAPSHTFTASVYPFLKHGAKVVWADIDLKTRVVTADTLEPKISSNTKALLVVHLYGYCADMLSIMDLGHTHNLLVIEDAAQALGTEFHGKKAGSFGDFGIFSFHSHKNISTIGEGGIITVKDEKMAEVIPMLRHNGHCGFDFAQKEYWKPAMGNVAFPKLNGKRIWPNNFCLGEIECALGSVLIDRIDLMNEEKRKRAISFIDALKDYPELEFHCVNNSRHNYHLLVARATNGKRDLFIKKMAYEKGIQCIVQYYPLNRYDFYKEIGYGNADCSNSDTFFDNMVSFPFHHWMSEDDLRYMLVSTRDVLQELRG